MSVDAVLIAGPTASGKSAAALALAARFGGAIVNADSMQVYRELRVLSARPGAEEQAQAPHFLYGQVSAHERYSAGRYQEDAGCALAEARARGLLPIFVGGTGLYFGVLHEGLSPIPPVPAEIRARVRARFAELGRERFVAAFALRDPDTVGRLAATDTQRLLRAADVLEATGLPLARWQEAAGKPVLAGLRVARLLLLPPREILWRRTDARFARMVEEGALEEVRGLMDLDPALPAARALGFPQLRRHLAGEIGLEQAVAEAQGATRRYVKRQVTWFRKHMVDWKWREDHETSNFITFAHEYVSGNFLTRCCDAN
jgi:tRNA dimethylallyltransferase